MLTQSITVIAGQASRGEGTICGFESCTKVACTAKAQNLAGLGKAVNKAIYTTEAQTKSPNVTGSFFMHSKPTVFYFCVIITVGSKIKTVIIYFECKLFKVIVV